ncbi:AEC family transporter [Clostridium chromiireducens]|uniref:AEC family transporter n=1 Tax=Clostridium chromiireducens TaxID=225345 RepID=A0A1V4IVP2_9CLOT|nr:AEC family transporter [Clostridium chromiireducens]MVX67215.1 AEC family transporter [Clostridium chromiireducens]OPJ63900.1 membrane transport protein [Clostridium chromiireducens]RII35710.1 AEC family transporter [Clostridium chromiireducens]
MEIPTIMNSIISLFLIILVGVYGSKKGIINSKVTKSLTDILLDITLPCMIISSFSFQYDPGVKINILKTFYYSFSAYAIIGISSFMLMFPVKNEKRIILHFANIFTNTGYIGFPVLNAVYGPEAVMYGSIFNIFFTILLWTYGVMIFKGNIEKMNLAKEMLKALKNPSLIAVYIGVFIMIFDLKLPEVISASANSIGNMTGPLSMIIVGALSYKIKLKEYLRDWTLYYGLTAKLIIIPIILYFISQLINDRTIVSNSVIILASMPAAAMTSIFADSFNIKREYASVFVVATTLFSIFTLPVLLKIIM